jgi:DNA-binding IclR family transcriptional regulator
VPGPGHRLPRAHRRPALGPRRAGHPLGAQRGDGDDVAAHRLGAHVRRSDPVVPIGRLFPLHAGASSKAFLAFLPEAERERFFAEHPDLPALTEHTVIDPVALRAELEDIRHAGFASSRGERQQGAASVAAPVFDRSGAPTAVISVCGPIERFDARRQDATRMLLEETAVLTRQAQGGAPLAF